MIEEKKVEDKEEEKVEEKKWREIIIETDGNAIRIKKAEVAGQLEFSAVLESVNNHLKNSQNNIN